jgi:hypothetical protein
MGTIGYMDWALMLEGQAGPGGILLMVDNQEEAESLADEVRRKGYPVVVRAHGGHQQSGLEPLRPVHKS